MKLLIAVPTYDTWEADFGASLALTMADLSRGEGIEALRLAKCEATIIAEGRTDLVRDALEHGASHILWCDADMKFRPSHVRTLMEHDVDIVGTTYRKRRPPHVWTAQDMNGDRIEPGEGPLVEAKHIGFGLALIKVSVFETVPEPWFAFPWIEEFKRFMGEDIWFCNHARAHGFKTYVDPKASIGIGHVGKQILGAD